MNETAHLSALSTSNTLSRVRWPFPCPWEPWPTFPINAATRLGEHAEALTNQRASIAVEANRVDGFLRSAKSPTGESLSVERRVQRAGVGSCLRLVNAGGTEVLELQANIVPDDGTASWSIRNAESDVSFTYKFAVTGAGLKAYIEGIVNGDKVQGVIDENGRASVNTSIGYWLSEEAKSHLDVFAATLSDENLRFRRIALKTLPRQLGTLPPPSPEGIMARSFWGTLRRAACWGFGSLGMAASCVGTFGGGCILGALGFGAAASVCSDADDD